MAGKFITFEGSEGCGKSTQIAELRRRLESRGMEVDVFREPGGTPAGEVIRDLLQHSEAGANLTPEAELLLFTASRAQLVRENILPALQSGRWVLADRFCDSTTVYQGAGRGLPAEAVDAINSFAIGPCAPDLTILLDMNLSEARRRMLARPGEVDRMEREPDGFFEAVRRGYLDLAQRFPGRIVTLDASGAADDVGAAIWNVMTERFDGLRR